MLEFLTSPEFILIVSGLLIGIFSVVFGGGMFFSVPVLQILFPAVSFGAIVGNLKVGSFFRGIGSTFSTWKKLDFKHNFIIGIPCFIGTVFGVSIISQLDQKWLFPAIIFAVLLAEIAPKIADKISKKNFYFAAILTGFYAGFLGAGIGVLLVALLRIKFPEDHKIAHVKIQARFLEWILVFSAIGTHFFNGDLIAKIWIFWSIGSLIGGFLGGEILHRIGHLSGHTQKIILRISFAFAIFVAAWKYFT